MSRSLIGENQVQDHDFLSEEEFAVASGTLQSQIDVVYAHTTTISGNPHNVTMDDIAWPGYVGDIMSLSGFLSHTESVFSNSGFDLTENGDGTVTITSGTAVLRNSTDIHTSKLVQYAISSGTTGVEFDALVNNTTNYICADYNSGSPTLTVATTLVDTAFGFTKIPIYFVTRVDNNTHVVDIRGITLNYACANTRKDCFTKGFEHVPGGSLVAESSTRYITITSGKFFYGSLEYTHPAFNTATGSTFTCIYRNGSGGWTRQAGQTQVDNTHYDDGSGTLNTLSNNNYGVHWLYLVFNTPDELFCLYGRQNNPNIASARVESLPTTLPPELQAGAVLLAKLIIQEGASTIYEIQMPSSQLFSYGVPTTHNGLSGIQGGAYNDYYHLTNTQYLDLIDGGETTLHYHPTPSGMRTYDLEDVSSSPPSDNYALIWSDVYNTYIPKELTSVSGVGSDFSGITLEPTGFLNTTDSILTWDDATLTFTISGTNGSYDIYSKGIKYTNTVNQLVGDGTDFTIATGLWFIYFDNNNNLIINQTPWSFFEAHVFVATLYWSGSKGIIGEERHGVVMDWRTHGYLHNTNGTRYISGLGAEFLDSSFTIEAGAIIDEDLRHIIDIASECRVLYKNESLDFEFTDAQSTYYYTVNDVLQYNNGNSLSDVDNNRYVAYWVFATNSIDFPIISISGQRQDTNLSDARENNHIEELVFGSFPYIEMKLIYRVILRRIGSSVQYIEKLDYRTSSFSAGGTLVVANHNTLANLYGGGFNEYYHMTQAQWSGTVGGGNNTLHTHDSRYYTETEVDGLITTVSGELRNHADNMSIVYAIALG